MISINHTLCHFCGCIQVVYCLMNCQFVITLYVLEKYILGFLKSCKVIDNSYTINIDSQQDCIPVGCVPPRALTVSPSMLWAKWSVCSRGVSAPGGVSARGVSAPGGSAPRGCLLLGDVCSRGVSAPRRVVSQHALRQTPLPVNRMTDASKNITLPQLCRGR